MQSAQPDLSLTVLAEPDAYPSKAAYPKPETGHSPKQIQ